MNPNHEATLEQMLARVHPDRRSEAMKLVKQLFNDRQDLQLPRDDRKEKLLDASLDEWDLSVRTRNCLKYYGRHQTIRTVITKSSGELMRLHGFGEKCLNEMWDVLADFHLKLDMEPQEFAQWYARDDVPEFRSLKPRR